jgi:DNA-binding PadR family transcriptional regulator
MKHLTRQEILILLSVYHLKDKAYLVTVRKYLIEVTGRSWSVGAVYVPLNRLEKLGYLDAVIGEPNAVRGRNQIKYYRLTKQSFEALEEMKRVNEALWSGFSELAYNL